MKNHKTGNSGKEQRPLGLSRSTRQRRLLRLKRQDGNMTVMEGDTTEEAVQENPKADEKVDEAKEEEAKEDASAAAAAVPEEGAILDPEENDVIAGRGAAVNLNKGNQKFRRLCFERKPEFDAASHAAKRRIATEIVNQTKAANGRFLKRKVDKGPWYEIDTEKAILKACQVMRDYQRPDRVALRGQGSGRKRHRTTEGILIEAPPATPVTPLDPIVENPFGVNDHDVLSGRGAFVNGHIGNVYFRELCTERKPLFDAGSYSEKRALATEVVSIVRGLEPPGRFLKRIKEGTAGGAVNYSDMPGWEELSDDKAIHKACQVMRDIARPDRTGERKRKSEDEEDLKLEVAEEKEINATAEVAAQAKNSMTILAETTVEASAVQEAVAATEEALDKVLDSVPKVNVDADGDEVPV